VPTPCIDASAWNGGLRTAIPDGKPAAADFTFIDGVLTMRKMIGALLVGVVLLSGSALGADFTLDGKNTRIEFIGSKPQGKHDGGFKSVTGTASVTGADATTLKLQVEIDTNSMYTDTPKLTQHLKSSDFFSVSEYPKAKFVTTKVEKIGKNYTITGDFTLLSKTKSISFPADIKAGADGLTITSNFTINRQDYGMSFGTGKVNNEVKIKVAVNASK
jgi:polyisoprenoid-binding protein YceI